jgi:hypothetical protein
MTMRITTKNRLTRQEKGADLFGLAPILLQRRAEKKTAAPSLKPNAAVTYSLGSRPITDGPCPLTPLFAFRLGGSLTLGDRGVLLRRFAAVGYVAGDRRSAIAEGKGWGQTSKDLIKPGRPSAGSGLRTGS